MSTRFLRFSGMRRSGNHAVIEWLLKNIGKEHLIFLNDCAPTLPVTRGFSSAEHGDVIYSKRKWEQSQDVKDFVNNHLSHEYNIISFEDRDLEKVLDLPAQDLGYPADTLWQDIYVTRSFLNWLASLHKHHVNRAEKDEKSVDEFSKRARARIDLYVKNIDFLTKNTDRVVIANYDRWLVDSHYREQLAQNIGVSITDNTTGHLARFGSSFGKGNFSEGDTALLERWQTMTDDQSYKSLLTYALEKPGFQSTIHAIYPDDYQRIERLAAQ